MSIKTSIKYNTLLICFVASQPVFAATPITNDGYPPLGGVTFAASGSSSPKTGTGRIWSFSSFDFTAFDQLWYGLNPAFLPQLAMNNDAGYAPSENLTFSAADSNLPSGVAVWTGSSDFTYNAPSTITSSLPVRFTMTLSGSGVNGFISSTDLLLIDPTFDTSQAVVTEVTGDFSVNLLMEAFKDGVWTPADDLFDAESTLMGDETKSSFGTAFYSTAVPEPSSVTLCALTAIGFLFRRKRNLT